MESYPSSAARVRSRTIVTVDSEIHASAATAAMVASTKPGLKDRLVSFRNRSWAMSNARMVTTSATAAAMTSTVDACTPVSKRAVF